jgi:cytochrome d ubiquinol oxidase subunit II
MNSVSPVCAGNETWLILGGAALMAAFPVAFAVVMPALYAPIIVMLLGLVFRGVAFEFRWRTERKYLWDWAFTAGSFAAALAQGIALGALVQGIPVSNRTYGGGWWDWLTWFSLLTGVALVVGYALLGATWLVLKTTGSVQAHAYRFAWSTGFATLALIGIVSLITPIMNPVAMSRWFAWPAILYVAPVPIFELATANSPRKPLRLLACSQLVKLVSRWTPMFGLLGLPLVPIWSEVPDELSSRYWCTSNAKLSIGSTILSMWTEFGPL